MSADIVTQLRATACCWRNDDPIAIELRQAADEIERLRAEHLGNAEELARLRERVTMLVEAAVEDAERAARLERVITNKEPLL